MEIAKADIKDILPILNLQYLAYKSEAELLGNYNIPPLTQKENKIYEEFKTHIFLKAIDKENNIIGSIRAYTKNNITYISKLMVSPHYQNNGIGTNLLIAIEQNYPAKKCALFTSSQSEKKLKLYQSLAIIKIF